MPTYYFRIRDGAAGIPDSEGTELPDDEAARKHAMTVIREIARNAEPRTRHWQLDVHDSSGELLFELAFAALDHTIGHLDWETRRLLERLCDAHRRLSESIFDSQALILRSRAIISRLRGRPYLVAQDGRRI
jgi:hypothetical protein